MRSWPFFVGKFVENCGPPTTWEHVQFAGMTQTRDTLVKARTALKNKISKVSVAATWRQQRIWNNQAAAIDHEMQLQEEELEDKEGIRERTRVALAFTAMANKQSALDGLLRYETSFSRMHDRAMKALHRLREIQNFTNDSNPAETGPPEPEITNPESAAKPTPAKAGIDDRPLPRQQRRQGTPDLVPDQRDFTPSKLE